MSKIIKAGESWVAQFKAAKSKYGRQYHDVVVVEVGTFVLAKRRFGVLRARGADVVCAANGSWRRDDAGAPGVVVRYITDRMDQPGEVQLYVLDEDAMRETTAARDRRAGYSDDKPRIPTDEEVAADKKRAANRARNTTENAPRLDRIKQWAAANGFETDINSTGRILVGPAREVKNRLDLDGDKKVDADERRTNSLGYARTKLHVSIPVERFLDMIDQLDGQQVDEVLAAAASSGTTPAGMMLGDE